MVHSNERDDFSVQQVETDDNEVIEVLDAGQPEEKKRGISFNILILFAYTLVLYLFSVYTNVNRPFAYLGGAVLGIAVVTALFIGRLKSRAVRMLYTLMFMFVQFGALMQLILHIEPLDYEPDGLDYFFYLTADEKAFVIDMMLPYVAALVMSLISVFVFKTVMKKHATMKLALLLTVLSALTYVLTIVFGISVGGTRVGVVMFGFTFQPGEFLKYIYCIIIGIVLGGGDDKLMQRRLKYASGVTLMFLGFMVLQGEFGTFQVVAMSYLIIVICYMGVKGILKLVAFVAALGIGSTLVYFANNYVLKISFLTTQFNKIFDRFRVWLDPDYDIYGAGYQMHQAMQKIYQAGWFGQYGSKNTIYAAENDLVIVSIIYAFGLITALALVIAFVTMAVNQVRVISRTNNSKLKIMAAIASTLLFSQVFFNIGGATGVIPLSGITLPFISKGGSSIVSVALMMTLVFMLAVEKEKGGFIDEKTCGYKDTSRAFGGGDSAGHSTDAGNSV
ncbi:MAG: FtsW/RodA/SpoVE family cell cycle protein [Clostridia bacterium]|nr:FtsW/RodA/SpoVE family cell cycle protein [Clostridia bacterium]